MTINLRAVADFFFILCDSSSIERFFSWIEQFFDAYEFFERIPADFFDPFTTASHGPRGWEYSDDALAVTFTCKSPLSGNVLKYLIVDVIKEADFDSGWKFCDTDAPERNL